MDIPTPQYRFLKSVCASIYIYTMIYIYIWIVYTSFGLYKPTFNLLTSVNYQLCLAAADRFVMEKVAGFVDFTFLLLTPTGGNEWEMKWSNLTNLCQMDRNHQVDQCRRLYISPIILFSGQCHTVFSSVFVLDTPLPNKWSSIITFKIATHITFHNGFWVLWI